MPQQNQFIEDVQRHERTWGNQSYTGRPTLADILAAEVVVFWQNPPKNPQVPPVQTISLHPSLDELGRYLARMFLRATATGERKYISKIYAGKRLVKIRSVQVTFEPASTD